MTATSGNAVEIRDVHFAYNEHAVLRGLTLDVPRGKVVGILGTSGSGKSTLLKLIGGQLRPARGTIHVDGEPVHGSRAIFARLEEIVPDPALYPEPIAAAVREADRWGDEELQDLGRRLPWGALHFRPEALGTIGGGPPLDPAGTDFAIKFLRAGWKYHGISAERLAGDLAGLPAKLERIDELATAGVIGGEAEVVKYL